MPGPYEGLFVLDASQGIAGPYCGMLLAQGGATVVKLEPPKGDWSRGLTTRAESHSVMHTAFNRGKRAVILDLSTEEGRGRAQQLAARADVRRARAGAGCADPRSRECRSCQWAWRALSSPFLRGQNFAPTTPPRAEAMKVRPSPSTA